MNRPPIEETEADFARYDELADAPPVEFRARVAYETELVDLETRIMRAARPMLAYIKHLEATTPNLRA